MTLPKVRTNKLSVSLKLIDGSGVRISNFKFTRPYSKLVNMVKSRGVTQVVHRPQLLITLIRVKEVKLKDSSILQSFFNSETPSHEWLLVLLESLQT